MIESEKCFMLLTATFQFTKVNFKQLYLLGFSLKLSEIDLARKLWKSTFMWLELLAIWSYRLGDTGQKVQHMQTGAVSTTSRKRLQLTYFQET